MHLAEPLLELLEVERPVVERRGQAEAVLDQRLLARAVAVVHAAHLRDASGGSRRSIISDVLGQVVEQRRRRLAGRAAGEVARVVLDAVAVARPRAASRGRTSCAARGAAPPAACPRRSSSASRSISSASMVLIASSQPRPRRHVVAGGVDRHLGQRAPSVLPVSGSKRLMRSTSSPKSSMRMPALLVGGHDLDHVAAHAEACRARARSRCGRSASPPACASRSRRSSVSPWRTNSSMP